MTDANASPVTDATVVGGGLAGCEAALALARRGRSVTLTEMRPVRDTAAHATSELGELVCTNSFKSEDPANAHGQLKREMRAMESGLLAAADATRVPAGSALAVDRRLFAQALTRRMESHPRIAVVRQEVQSLPSGPTVVATGPLTSAALAASVAAELGEDSLAFYDAIAPIVHVDSIDRSVVFAAGRFGEDADYLNCPMTRAEYEAFVDALTTADVYPAPEWDQVPYFEGCLPVEVMAQRGRETLRFGPLKPVGLTDPRTGGRPHAVVQLRREDRAGQMWNMVGFQTRLRTGEQRRVFSTIPGLAAADFLRWGSVHRNTYLNFPARLAPCGAPPGRADLIFAGQLTGVEGYTESAASGILAGINLDRVIDGKEPVLPPPDTMLGGLYRYLGEADPTNFQPMNSNWGLVDPLPGAPRKKAARRQALAERADGSFRRWLTGIGRATPADAHAADAPDTHARAAEADAHAHARAPATPTPAP